MSSRVFRYMALWKPSASPKGIVARGNFRFVRILYDAVRSNLPSCLSAVSETRPSPFSQFRHVNPCVATVDVVIRAPVIHC